MLNGYIEAIFMIFAIKSIVKTNVQECYQIFLNVKEKFILFLISKKKNT